MTDKLGFGKAQAKPNVSKRAAVRTEAVKRYDKMKAEGIPDFEVYIRIQGKKAWYPVGSIAVKRSDQINRAIFNSQDNLLQGAFGSFQYCENTKLSWSMAIGSKNFRMSRSS
jgi:hypothetical protein